MLTETYPFKLPPLPYGYSALEPNISEETMRIHHDILFKRYIDKLNLILEENPDYKDWNLFSLLSYNETFAEPLAEQLRNNGGAVLNHYLYFDGMTPTKKSPSGNLKKAINRDFGSEAGFNRELKKAALSHFGSGNVWLMYDGACKLRVVNSKNADPPPFLILKPILLVDIWEHSYFLQYKQKREEYFDAWYNLIDWDKAELRYPCG